MKRQDLTGRVFHELTVLSEVTTLEGRARYNRYFWVQCSCGRRVIANHKSLRSGDMKSCGHLLRQNRKRPDVRRAIFGGR